MTLMNTDTILARSTESRKYTMTEVLTSIAATDTNDIIVVGGHSKDGKGIIHCLGQGGELKWSQTYPKIVNCVDVAGQGKYICVGGEGKAAHLLTAFGQMVWTDECRSDIKSIAISSSGRYCAVGMADGNLNVYDNDIVAARKFAWKHRFGKAITGVDTNGDGTLVCASTEEGELAVFTERGDLVWSKILEKGVGAFKIAPEGDAIIIACNDEKLRLFSAEVGKSLWTVSGGGVFNDVGISSKGERVVGVSKDGGVYCYDKTGALLWKYEMGNPGETVRISKNGKTVIAASIDAVVHCIDVKGNLVWKHKTGSSDVLGLVVSESGDMVISSCEIGILYFDNIQVVGGLLPVARHEITLAKERGVATFKAEKNYEEAVVALNFGDYVTAAAKIRELEKALGPAPKIAPSPDAVVAPTPASDEAQNVRAKIDAVLADGEAVKKRGGNVEPVENLLGEAMVLLEDGNLVDALAYVQDAKEMLDDVKGNLPPEPKPVAPTTPPPGQAKAKEDALKAVEKAAAMLAELEDTEIRLEAAIADLKTARDLYQNADYQHAITAANRAVLSMEKTLEPYITDCLMSVQKLLKNAEKEGVATDKPKNDLGKVRDQIKSKDYMGALDLVTEVESCLEEALRSKTTTSPPVAPAKPVEKPIEAPKPSPTPTLPAKPGGLDALKAEMSVKPKKPDEPGSAPVGVKPVIDVAKITSKDDPLKDMAEADEALKTGALVKAVEIYMRSAETVVERARAIVEESIAKASEQVAKVKKEGFDVTEAHGLVEAAKRDLGAVDYISAVSKAMQAIDKADNAAAAEIAKVIDESRKALEMAQKIGANIQAAEELINNAESSMKKRDYKVAIEFADKGVAEVEKTSNATVMKILFEGKSFLEKAATMGADVSSVKTQFDEAQKALDARIFIKAHEMAKQAVELAKELPKKYVTEKLNLARTKVVTAEKLGADTMMAKNYMIKARSSLAANDFDGAIKALEKCFEETARAPKDLVSKRMAMAKADVEDVRAMGQSTSDAEALLGQAEGMIASEKFDEALKLVEFAHKKLVEIKDLGKMATNTIFDADMAISIARDAGKDVTKANELMHQALEVRAKDPAKAKDLAIEIKKMLEG